MAEEEVIDSSAGGDHAAGGEKRLSSKKLMLFIILPILLILAGGAGLYFTGMLDSVLHKKPAVSKEKAAEDKKAAEEADKGPGYYYDMPDILVNMNDTGNKSRYLKLSMSLELSSKLQEPKLEAVMPRITDNFQTYLRELRVDDLRGSAGIYRLRQELLARVRTAADPVVIRDVLFREILVQ